MILGNDFLKQHNSIINFKENIIILDDQLRIKLNIINTLDTINEIKIKNNRITEIIGNIFNSPPELANAHCVSSDLRTGNGIAKEICDTHFNTK